ncbi:tetratricopeptide repeat protein [Flavitalea sp. BT771]|uniref:tetratricopeptide repeat protein n=1 Tax=Flavitalea sp. BT771 TaxID=3063329 RepID=UPI0026E1C101|nr:tetratricopeptide repeat protein [Flavitalea sp. BT771]MDO6430040.1 tetratricopeptide repeat protein [Flavitalea sp. BT771]MDV6219821.1 tetratricopeptide repeat protein [Flavitalea sp. BT771]
MKYALFFCLVFLGSNLSAQKKGQPLVDSLVGELPAMKDDSNKVRFLALIAQNYMLFNPNKGFIYAENALQLAEKIQWKKGIANIHNNLGLMIGDTGNNALARVHFGQSYALNKEMDSKINQINNLNNIGRSYNRESDYSQAIAYYFKALTIAEEMKSSDKISLVGTNITATYLAQRNYAKATEYAEMTLKHGELAKSPDNTGKALDQLGVIKMETKDSAAAKVYFQRALKVYEDMGNQPQTAGVLANLANLEYPDHQRQITIMLRAQAIYDAIGGYYIGSIGNIANLGQTYYDLAMKSAPAGKAANLKEAEKWLLRGIALSRQTSNPEYLGKMSLSLANLEETRGNYRAALENYKTYSSINDSLFSQDKKNEIAGLEGRHNIAVKDNEIALNQLKLADQRRTQIGLIAGLLLLGVIGALLYWQSRSRKKTNTTLMVLNSQLDEANKVKAKFFAILSHDLRSPVANLIHFLHLQKNDPDLLSEEQGSLHRQEISQSAENLLETMEFMLIWSKEQMENFRCQIKNVLISDLFDYLQKFFAQIPQVAIRFSCDPGMEVPADENYLRIIMQNLTANAIKALKDTPNAMIEWKAVRDGKNTLISITDNGPGISDEQALALNDNSITANAKNGFGLHLVRDLAKAIRYKISIQSRLGIGTTFTLQQYN